MGLIGAQIPFSKMPDSLYSVAQETNGATLLFEHRFYGLSNPYPDLTTKSLRVHTTQQAIDDLVYFARNVVLPIPSGGELTPDKVPWVLVGGSYSGRSSPCPNGKKLILGRRLG